MMLEFIRWTRYSGTAW